MAICEEVPFSHWLEAADVGWRFGDEIVAVNGKAVASREDGHGFQIETRQIRKTLLEEKLWNHTIQH